MLIALLSDTHDNAANTRAALALLAPHQPAAYIHCGDLCDPEMLAHFAGLPFHFVFGNNDFDHAGLRACASEHKLHCLGKFGTLTLAGKTLAVLHGDDIPALRQAQFSNRYDYIFLGHSHQTSDTRPAPRTRQINPGALHRAPEKTVALLDLATDTLQFLIVPRPSLS
jgi:putative phosphoesterase